MLSALPAYVPPRLFYLDGCTGRHIAPIAGITGSPTAGSNAAWGFPQTAEQQPGCRNRTLSELFEEEVFDEGSSTLTPRMEVWVKSAVEGYVKQALSTIATQDLKNMCSEISLKVKHDKKKPTGLEVRRQVGLWLGNGNSYGHEWLEFYQKGTTRSLLCDPTYTQFAGGKWRWSNCKRSAVENCVFEKYADLKDDETRLLEQREAELMSFLCYWVGM